MMDEMKYEGEKERVYVTIPTGMNIYTHVFQNSYESPPKAYFSCGGDEYSIQTTTLNVIITMNHFNGVSGQLVIYMQ